MGLRPEAADSIFAIVLSLVRNADGEFLLVDRQRGDFVGYHGFPGGKIEVGEHLAHAIRREVLEETGIDTRFDTHCGVVSEFVRDDDGSLRKHLNLNICQLKPEETAIPESHEGVADWYSLDEIRGFKQETIPSLLPIAEAFTGGDITKRYYESVIGRDGDQWVLERFE